MESLQIVHKINNATDIRYHQRLDVQDFLVEDGLIYTVARGLFDWNLGFWNGQVYVPTSADPTYNLFVAKQELGYKRYEATPARLTVTYDPILCPNKEYEKSWSEP